MLQCYYKLLSWGLGFLSLAGINPLKSNPVLLIFAAVMLSAVVFISMFGYFFGEKSFPYYMELGITIFTIISALIKLVTNVTKKEEMKEMIRDMDQFWPIDINSPRVHLETNGILHRWNRLQKYYRIYIVTLLLVCNPIIMITQREIIVSYVPPIGPEQTYLIINTVAWNLVAIVISGFDQFFCAILVLLRVQFKIFNNALGSIDYSLEDKENEYIHIRKCVLYHNFLLRFVRKVNDVFGGCLFAYCQCVLILICLLTYRLSLTSNDVPRQIEFLMVLPGLLTQLLFFYCLPAELLHSEMSNTMDCIWGSNFYQCSDLGLGKSLLIMTIRASTETQITAGKVRVINLNCFTQICKAAYSFYTALRNISQ